MDAATAAAGYIVNIVNDSSVACTIARATASDTISSVTSDYSLPGASSISFVVAPSLTGYTAIKGGSGSVLLTGNQTIAGDKTFSGTTSLNGAVVIQNTSATTNAVTQVLRVDSQSSGTPATGIGVGIEFATETAAGNTEVGATIEAITTDVTSTSEDFDLSFKTMAAGAAASEQMRVTSVGNLQYNSGYGSVATAYGCRAWVNFNGTGTVAIRASGNVSSITDNGTGDYTVNFTNAMPDANYCYELSGQRVAAASNYNAVVSSIQTPSTTALRVVTSNDVGVALEDFSTVCVAIFR